MTILNLLDKGKMMNQELIIDQLKFDSQGLIPAIIQDEQTRDVLMLAYMNRQSLEMSLQKGETIFWSRSRQSLWHKGETSGNTQTILSITPDCDYDTLLVLVRKEGPACHTGAETCFFAEPIQSNPASGG
jgi:phosphoribosyl-ATP pyrophosphohydrolase/phosphoribosyl-AMP cyclohydrolase